MAIQYSLGWSMFAYTAQVPNIHMYYITDKWTISCRVYFANIAPCAVRIVWLLDRRTSIVVDEMSAFACIQLAPEQHRADIDLDWPMPCFIGVRSAKLQIYGPSIAGSIENCSLFEWIPWTLAWTMSPSFGFGGRCARWYGPIATNKSIAMKA